VIVIIVVGTGTSLLVTCADPMYVMKGECANAGREYNNVPGLKLELELISHGGLHVKGETGIVGVVSSVCVYIYMCVCV
jgi:hypothetical protein